MPGNKRIVFVANTSWSIYRFRLYLLKTLTQSGFDVFVLAPRDRYTAHFEHLPGVQYTSLEQFDNKRISVLQDYRLYKELKWHYKRIQPDLIFHYTIKANIFGTVAAGRSGYPSVSVITGLGYAFLQNSLLQLVAKTLYRFSLRHATEVWFLNTDDQDVFITHKLIDNMRSFLLPGEGIDTTAFYPAPYGDAKQPVTFLLVGRLMKHKGIYEFVEAARLLKQKGISISCQLLGTLDEQSATTVSRRDIEQWTKEELITYLGETDQVAPHIAAADCIVLPSYREGLPLSLLEGASMCKFLIATDTAGCRDIITDQENGYLCAVKDAQDLAAKMEAYYHLPAARKNSMGLKGREKITAQYRQEIVAGIYQQKIHTLLALPQETVQPENQYQ
jgi:glycosyltransferase involved in cell wall biosynthesis